MSNLSESGGKLARQSLPRRRQFHSPMQTAKQDTAQLMFQRTHVAADGSLRYMKFAGSLGETQAARRSFEGTQSQ
jgi:hypothetical protein